MGSLPELTTGRLLSSWHLDVPALLLVVLLGVLYGWGVLRLRRRGERWPVSRLAAFSLVGLGTLVAATMSALAVYDRVLFWPAAVQNVLLDLIAPLGLALGDPLRLALRALPEPAVGRVRRVTTGRLVRLLTFPLVSTALVLATELTVYFTPYFATALRHGWLHELLYLHLLLVGSLFVVPVLTREEALPETVHSSGPGGARVPRRNHRRRAGHCGDDPRHADRRHLVPAPHPSLGTGHAP